MIRIVLLLLLPVSLSAQTVDATLLPVSNVTVEICSHRLNAVATYSDNTDGVLAPSKYYAELYAFKYNIQPTLFLNPFDRPELTEVLRGMQSTNRWSFDIYYPTDKWINPVTSSLQEIPDYYRTTYTSAGAAVFAGVVAGQAKITRQPNHGQQLYDVSNGAFGYDFSTGDIGISNFSEINGLTTYLQNYFVSIFGYKPSTLSYRNGRYEGALELNNLFIAGRNSFHSETGDSRTSFANGLGNPVALALDRYDRINQASSTRWWDMGHNTAANNYTVQELNKTIANGGWMNNFMHYHYVTGTQLNGYWNLVNTTIGSNFVWRSGMGEAMSYMWMRNAITRISSRVINDTLQTYLTINLGQYLDSVQNNAFPYNNLRPYISLLINVSGTSLVGKELESNKGGILKLTDSTFILDFALNSFPINKQAYSVSVYETATPNYIDLALPVVTNSIKTISSIDVSTDLPTYAVLFRCPAGESDYNSIPIQRDAVLDTVHHFNISEDGDYRVGLITEYNQSILTLIP